PIDRNRRNSFGDIHFQEFIVAIVDSHVTALLLFLLYTTSVRALTNRDAVHSRSLTEGGAFASHLARSSMNSAGSESSSSACKRLSTPERPWSRDFFASPGVRRARI